jgi:hypothetical protein
MLLYEILLQKNILDKKILELKNILKYNQDDDIAHELFALIDLRQSKLLSINKANNSSNILIGDTEVDVSTTIIIMSTIKNKIDVLTSLISDQDCKLNKIELQTQRDKFYEEYILLRVCVERNDLNVTVK